MTRQPISRHAWDHLPGGQDAAWNDPWVYIGTFGVDNADEQILGNPAPFNPDLDDYLNIPFENSWTNAGEGFSPVCFMVTVENNLEIHGAFTGGSDNTVVFTLPDLSTISTPVRNYWAPTPNADPTMMGTYWPLAPKPLVGSFIDGTGTFTFLIGTDGTVTYQTGATYV